VSEAIALEPNHLSLYLLELYPNAPLKESMARRGWSLAPDDEAADMYQAAYAALDEAGFEQYEISNTAQSGHQSRHNVKYWQGGIWRGFGCGAHSTVDETRWKNVASTAEYIDRLDRREPVAIEVQSLSERARLEEALFTGLRLTAGVDGRNILARYGVDPWIRYGQALAPFVDDGLMWRVGDRFGLTRAGMLVANEILMTFV
jgi:oxygen-independent coproporphyrinogen-3 oxidase